MISYFGVKGISIKRIVMESQKRFSSFFLHMPLLDLSTKNVKNTSLEKYANQAEVTLLGEVKQRRKEVQVETLKLYPSK